MSDVDLETPEGRRRWAQQCADYLEKQMANYKPTDRVDAICHDASRKAEAWAKDAGLHPYLSDDGEYKYKVQQARRAAHWAREDAAATLLLMRSVLYDLRSIKRLLWIVVALLVIVLWRHW